MKETLEAVAAGELSVSAAEARLSGYATTASGRFDAARETRRGIPEAILAEGKTPAEVVDLAETAVETAGRALVTRADDAVIEAVTAAFGGNPAAVDVDDRAGTITVTGESFEHPSLAASVCIVTGGTADYPVAGEALAVVEAVGADCTVIADIGVANIDRLFDQLERIREADVVIAVAGREAALPTVVAGQVDCPVIGVPVSSGYGHGGDGEAALSGLLQSCSALSVVNIDAGFTAGTQAALIARRVDGAERDN
jgi:NCAIR mutase (PurE)-related protein